MKLSMKKSLTVLTLTTMLTAGASSAFASELPTQSSTQAVATQAALPTISITIDGKKLEETGYQQPGAAEPMLPLRAIAETLGFKLEWNADTYAAHLQQSNFTATATTGKDDYAMNKMIVKLGAAPELQNGRMYVPASFVSKVLQASVSTQGGSVTIDSEVKKTITETGVITGITNDDKYPSVHIQGVATEGIVLNVGPETTFEMKDGTKLTLADLHIGMTVEAEHSLVMTLSLPPQTPTYRITVLDAKPLTDALGTAGEITEIRTGDKGETTIVIKGEGLSDQSPGEVALRLTDESQIVDKNGNAVNKDELMQGAKVIGFYSPMLTKSLPPIGNAWKIVVSPKTE